MTNMRNATFSCILLTILIIIDVTNGAFSCDTDQAAFRVPGNATILAYFGVHRGATCDKISWPGIQMMTAAALSVKSVGEALLPGIDLGISIYDSCDDKEMTKKAIVASLVEAKCYQQHVIGSLGDERSSDFGESISSSLSHYLTRSYADSVPIPYHLVADLLATHMKWNSFHLVTYQSPFSIVHEFRKAASSMALCIITETTMDKVQMLPEDSSIVVLAPNRYLRSVVDGILDKYKFFLLPTDGLYTTIPARSKELTILASTTLSPFTLENTSLVTETAVDGANRLMGTGLPTILGESESTLMEIQLMEDMSSLIKRYRSVASELCGGQASEAILCPAIQNGVEGSTTIITKDEVRIRRVLKMLGRDHLEGHILLRQTGTVLSKLSTYTLQPVTGWTWVPPLPKDSEEDDDDNDATKTCLQYNDTRPCSSCHNYEMIVRHVDNLISASDTTSSPDFFSSITLKDEAWVAALLSISAVGIISCLAISIFIIVRLCKRDVLEGNPSSSFLLLFSLIVMYLIILPYCFTPLDPYYDSFFCAVRLLGTSLSYSLVYSIMLARGVMLASCDKDGGFMSHINGYIQAVLCFFMAAVQIALAVQFWVFNWVLLDKSRCQDVANGSSFLLLLTYNVFLLAVLMAITPFIAKSKRNYYEGGYYTAAVWMSGAVWLSWCMAYAWLGPAWQHVTVCCGLVATATSLLVTIFIPRTYLMVTGIVRDHIVSTLPSLAHHHSVSCMDVSYRSTQALYDSVMAGTSHSLHQDMEHAVGNPYYIERPTTPSTTRVENSKSPDNTYERYDSPPSPQNITRF